MNDTDGALEWREMAEHLVQAHGADPDCLTCIRLRLQAFDLEFLRSWSPWSGDA